LLLGVCRYAADPPSTPAEGWKPSFDQIDSMSIWRLAVRPARRGAVQQAPRTIPSYPPSSWPSSPPLIELSLRGVFVFQPYSSHLTEVLL